jgi:hypothetical protein
LIFSGDKSATPFIFAHAWSKVADKLLNASALTIKLEDLPFFPLRPERSERPLSSLFLPAAAPAAPAAPNRGEIDQEKEILFLITVDAVALLAAAAAVAPRALVGGVVAIIIAYIYHTLKEITRASWQRWGIIMKKGVACVEFS